MKLTFRYRILVVVMLLFIAISSTTSFVNYAYNKKSIQQEILDKNMLVLTALCDKLSDEVLRMQSHATMILIHPSVTEYITNIRMVDELGIDYLERTVHRNSLQKYYFGMQHFDPTFMSMALLIDDTCLELFSMYSYILDDSMEKIRSSEWYNNVEDLDKPYFVGCHENYFGLSYNQGKKNENKQCFSVAKRLYNLTTKEVYAVILCSYDADALIERYSVSLTDEGHTFYVVEKKTGRVLLSNAGMMDGMPGTMQGFVTSDISYVIDEERIMLKSDVPDTDYAIAVEIPIYENMFATARRLLASSMVLSFCGTSIFFLIFMGYSHRFSRPVRLLLQTMQQIGHGNLQARVDQTKMLDEFEDIAQHLNKMSDQLTILMDHTKQKEREKNEATFLALQMQINPHFMCNTLNCIRLLALMQNEKQISNALEATIKVLSGSFRDIDAYTTICEDVEQIKAYTEIMKLRYGDIFTIRYEINPQVEQCKILRFMIQPCVENAILHGMVPRSEPGEICISARSKGNRLLVEISDNGVGTDTDFRQYIDKKEKMSKYNSIGISNVCERIRLMYGDTAEVSFSNAVNQGVTISFYLPLEWQDNNMSP